METEMEETPLLFREIRTWRRSKEFSLRNNPGPSVSETMVQRVLPPCVHAGEDRGRRRDLRSLASPFSPLVLCCRIAG